MPLTLPPEIFKAYDIRGVVGKTLTPPIVRAIGQALGSLLELALGAFKASHRRVGGELRGSYRADPVTGNIEAKVQVDGPGHGLERGRQERRPMPATALGLTLAQ